MKKKRLGEILRERNQVSVENLEKAIHDQQGKLVHLGELLFQRGVVSKPGSDFRARGSLSSSLLRLPLRGS